MAESLERTASPRTFDNTSDWFRINNAWQFRPPMDLHGTVDPGTVEAASGHTFVITLRVGPDLVIPTGAHLTMEVPTTWEMHLGNGFRRAVKTVGSRAQNRVGYGAFTDAECSDPNVTLDLVASWGRHMDLVDVVITHGEVRPGESIRITLGPPDGNLVQVQKHAQVAILTTAVDTVGDGTYRRAATYPTITVIGAAADRFRVVAPAVAHAGTLFPVRVLPVDVYAHNPAGRYRGMPRIHGSAGLIAPDTVAIGDEHAIGRYGMTASAFTSWSQQPGIHALTITDPVRGLIGKSNPIGVDFLPDRGIYFGELHSQMWDSMGTGTTEEFFEWGRDVALLDFCAPANHYGRRVEVTDDVWQRLVDTCNAYDDPGCFATMVSYEWGGTGGSGHKNVYYRGASGDFHHWYRRIHKSPEDLWNALDGQDALTIPHHTKFGSPTDWSYRNDRQQRLVEICSQWGISEEGGPHSIQAALAMGHRLGFVGGTDSHHGLANQGEYHVNDGNGLACVHATALTRDAIWQALHDRRCYATTGDRILLDVTMELDGRTYPMGSDVEVGRIADGPRRLRVRVAGTASLDRIEVLRNNDVQFTATPNTDTWEGGWTDADPLNAITLTPTFDDDRPFVFYYVRLTQANRQRAWSSPIWLTERAA